MKRLFVFWLLAAAVLSTLLPACGQLGGQSALKVGFIGPMTGDVKTFGESTKNGFEMAVAEWQAKGMKIETVIADDKNDPTETSNAATKLVNQDKVQIIIESVEQEVENGLSYLRLARVGG